MLDKKERAKVIESIMTSLKTGVEHVETCQDEHHHPLDKDDLLFFFGGLGAALLSGGMDVTDVNKILEEAMTKASKLYKLERD